MEQKKRILVVDDEEPIVEALKFNLEMEGYDVDTAFSAEQALKTDLSQYSLILLDIMMDGISGTQMAQMMRRDPKTAAVPIIFCTAKDTDEDMVRGLDLGADDYIAKPFAIQTVLARIRAVLRRTSPEPGDTVKYGDIVIDRQQKCVTLSGQEVKMPRKELEILTLLMTHPGRVFSRAELLSRIWTDEVVVLDRVVDVNITRLRSKLGPYAKCIVTRSGYGYGFMPQK